MTGVALWRRRCWMVAVAGLVLGIPAVVVGVAVPVGGALPSSAWARAMGGTEFDQGRGVAVDGSGNVYTTGSFSVTADFDPGPGVFNLTSAGDFDVFVSKLDSGGNLVWARAMGGTDFDGGWGIAVDGSGNIYTTGVFSGTADFDPGPGVFNLTSADDLDVFVSKLDSGGNLVWARAMGGTDFDGGWGIAVDGSGNVYTTGSFRGTADFDPSHLGIYTLFSAGGHDVFVSKLDSGGNFGWALRMGGTSSEEALGIAVDGSGNVDTTGFFGGTVDFDPWSGVFNLTSAGGGDVFVSKLDSGGNFVWARRMGGTSSDEGLGIAVDGSGNVYTTGSFYGGTVDFDPGLGVFGLTSAGGEDVFVSKLDSGGNFVWARAMGGIHFDDGWGIAVDGSGNVYTTGSFSVTADFDPGLGVFALTSAGGDDVFVSKLDSGGNLVWARAMGGTDFDGGRGIAVDGSDNVYTTGSFRGTADFDPGPGVFNLTSAGHADVFVSKPGDTTPPVVALTSPAEGATVTHNATVLASYSCADDELGGSGVASCVGDVPDGAAIDTATAGPKTFTVTGSDHAGNETVVTHNYTVTDVTEPTVIIATPAAGATVAHNATVLASYSCADELGGSGVASCVGDVADGAAIDTATAGPKTFTVTGSDHAGNSTVVTHNYTVSAAPPPPPATPDTVGLVDPTQGRWHLRDSAGQVTSFFFGNPGDVPVMGDWDGDGVDTPGLFRTSDAFAYLSNANRSQIADIRFFFGNPSDIPLAGDWDGDGDDTLSIYRPSEQRFYIVNQLGQNEGGLGPADISFGFGNPGDKPVVGDWDNDGIDEVGLHRESTGFFYWRNTLTTGIADGEIFFGDPGDRFVSGDWGMVDGKDTPAVFRPSNTTMFFRHTLTQGVADSQFVFGETAWLPVAGAFGLG